ncbi:hypothetical protein B0H16DRAFT_1879005, partial [Mycena metata]
ALFCLRQKHRSSSLPSSQASPCSANSSSLSSPLASQRPSPQRPPPSLRPPSFEHPRRRPARPNPDAPCTPVYEITYPADVPLDFLLDTIHPLHSTTRHSKLFYSCLLPFIVSSS